MKAVQIGRYSKTIGTILRNIPVPELDPTEVLLQVKAAAVNPLELLILTGSVKLIQDYPMPLTLGNECSGVVKAVGRGVTGFHVGDRVYTRLPLSKIGAFAEYVAVDQSALAVMPAGYDFATAAAAGDCDGKRSRQRPFWPPAPINIWIIERNTIGKFYPGWTMSLTRWEPVNSSGSCRS